MVCMKYWHNGLTGEAIKSDVRPNGQFWQEISRDEYLVIVKAVSDVPEFYPMKNESDKDGQPWLALA